MATVKDIIATKGSQVWSVAKDATVLQAAEIMKEHNIGGIIVTDQGRFVGIFTERDVLRRIVAEQRDPARTQVGAVMTADPACCTGDMTIEAARAVMRDKRIRHLPMVDSGGQLLGVISIGDLNAHQLAAHEQTIHQLHEYLYGRV